MIVDNSTILGYVVAHGTTVLFPRRQDGGVSAVDAERQRPTVVILGATSEEPPPGLGPIAESTSFRFAADAQELEGAIGGADVLLVWDFRSTELQDAWHRVDKLRWVHVAGAGVDAVLFPDMVDSRVTLTNSRGVFDRSIAEYVLGLMLAFAKDLHQTIGLQQQKKWVHRETEMLAGGKLLVVGAGSIGRTIARLARCAGMEVDAIARTARSSDEDFGRVLASEDLNDVLPEVDYVVVAAPLTAQTRGMFGAAQFERMKPGR